ncbi:MAG: hypothetical protein IKI93_19865, partial [Clostridia bacterium]|nr:hypothetical protein [Clostridia bacterium]
EISKKIDAHLQTADKRSRSDFIESAVNFYCGVLDTDGNREFLSEEIIRAMKSIVKDMEGRIFLTSEARTSVCPCCQFYSRRT